MRNLQSVERNASASALSVSGFMLRRTAALAVLCGLLAAGPALLPAPARANFEAFAPANDRAPFPTEADGTVSAVPTIRAHRLAPGEAVRIDGRLDDGAWLRAEAGSGFRQWDPDRGKSATEQTVFKVVYDDDALIFGVACLEDDPDRVSRKLSRRDNITASDLVSIYLDPYDDKTTGYNFRVNPLGVQQDAYMFNDGDRDDDWDAVWQAETYADEGGWYTEVRIPFSSIRYRAGQPTWGLEVYRYMHGRGEDTAWVTWPRESSGFVSRFGRLSGLRGVPAPRQLEIVPYLVERTKDPAVDGPGDDLDHFEDFGADLKYGLTAALTLNATVQPDFGQVEADPSVLNLSPFETFFDEKRPFFIEGSRFFEMPNFNLFYSRRIGTGDANSRIRYAAKLTGKAAGNVTLAGLVASTDVTGHGQAHNFLKGGDRTSRYLVARVGKEFNQGKARFHLMQTAALNSADRAEYGDYASRDAYSTGADFDLRFGDRAYQVLGSFVGTVVDHEPLSTDPGLAARTKYGTGGELDLARTKGAWRASAWGRWESDKLDPNDLGFLSAPDEMNSGFWVGYRYNPEGRSEWANTANLNYNFSQSWLYAGRTGYDLGTGQPAWSYGRGHRTFLSTNVNGWVQFRSYREAWFGVQYVAEGTQRYETRSTVTLENGDRAAIRGGGPLMGEPETYGGWAGASTDTRKDLVLSFEGNHFRDRAQNATSHLNLNAHWSQSSAVNHDLGVEYVYRLDDTQHLGNFENPEGGIGGVSYVFAKIWQKTLDFTLRTNVLFSRNQSLELYAQPYLTVGSYEHAKELAAPDTYTFLPYHRNGFRAPDHDFTYSAVNLNAVYRWEYRPGSTLYLVWTHSRDRYRERADYAGRPGAFNNDLGTGALFRNEPENVFLAKLTYWIPM